MLAGLVYPVDSFLLQSFTLFGFTIFWLWSYLVKVIPGSFVCTKLNFYDFITFKQVVRIRDYQSCRFLSKTILGLGFSKDDEPFFWNYIADINNSKKETCDIEKGPRLPQWCTRATCVYYDRRTRYTNHSYEIFVGKALITDPIHYVLFLCHVDQIQWRVFT
jgi:hypothetical protein